MPAACPACGKPIEPRPSRRRKCPHCREWVVPRGAQLLTEGQARDLDAKQASQVQALEAQRSTAKKQELRGLVAEVVAERNGPEDETARFADFKMFRTTLSPWETLFQQAAEFATQLGPGRVISISHSEDDNEAVVTVWYWRPAYEVQSSGP
jgi:hypothetical protein